MSELAPDFAAVMAVRATAAGAAPKTASPTAPEAVGGRGAAAGAAVNTMSPTTREQMEARATAAVAAVNTEIPVAVPPRLMSAPPAVVDPVPPSATAMGEDRVAV